MRLLSYVIIVLLWSSYPLFALAQIDIAEMERAEPFRPIPSEYSIEDQTIKIDNMSRVRSTDSLNTCYGCVSATMAQKYICDNDPKYQGKKCSDVGPEMEVAQFDLMTKAITNKIGQTPGVPANHTNLNLSKNTPAGIWTVTTMMNARILFDFNSEACFPFDQLVEKYGTTKPQLLDKFLGKLENTYKKKMTEAGSECTECLNLNDINNGLAVNINQDTFDSALKQNSFEEFLYTLVFNRPCNQKISMKKHPKVGMFPQVNDSSKAKSLLLPKIIESLSGNGSPRPVALGDICTYKYKSENKDRCLSHTVVLTGYKLLCKSPGKNCKPALRVQNCLGQDWQNRKEYSNDGWVDAENLIKNVSLNSAELSDGVISWYY